MNVKIRKSAVNDIDGMMKVAGSLHPLWFDKVAINESMPIDLNVQKGYVAEDKGTIIGFVTYTSDNGNVKISWLGILPEYQRRGIGARLLKVVEKELGKIGVKKIRVETVAESEKYEPYERTRAFYIKMGFKVEKVEKAASKDTGEKFDLATYVKNL